MLRTLSLAVFSALVTSVLSSCASPDPELPWANLAITAPLEGRYLHRTNSGDPFMWVADTNWELFHRLNRTDVDLFLADRAAKGFNVIQVVVASKYNATTLPNFYGDLVFENGDPATPNENYFSYVDFVTARAAEYGILLCFVPTWGRYVNHGWYGTVGPILFNDTNAEAFGHYLGRRYPGIPKMLGGDSNVIWADNVPQVRQAWRQNQSIDPRPLLDPLTDTAHIWAAMMRGLKRGEAERGSDAFVFYHPTNSWISNTPLPFGHNVGIPRTTSRRHELLFPSFHSRNCFVH